VVISIILAAGFFRVSYGCDEPLPPGKVGSTTLDGILVDILPETGHPLYAASKDAPRLMTYGAAIDYCAGRLAGGHNDWRLPSKRELDVLFENREQGALKGTFNLTGSYPAGWYWSGTPYNINNAYGQRFSDGIQDNYYRGIDSSVRCVR
jgi:hypothetical protein